MTRPARRARPAVAVPAAVAATASASLLAATTAVALPVPLDPANADVAEQWVNDAVRPDEGSQAELSLIDAPTRSDNGMFHVKLRITNRSDASLYGLAVTPRRGPATGSVWDQRVAAVAQLDEYLLTGSRHGVSAELAPGQDAELDLQIDPVELPLPPGDTYPLLFQLTDSDGVTLDTERFHFSSRGDLPDQARPAGMTALYPISAEVDILPGETGEAPEDPQLVLSSENLAGQLAPGGRLDRLVDTYLEASKDPQVADATCVALDPALLDAVDRMADGYVVADTRSPVAEEPKRLRDSWGSANSEPASTPGTGDEDAAAWLTKVRAIAQNDCTVSLPWGNTDIDAVSRTGDPWLVREAIERGPFVLEKVLGTTGTTNVVVPSSGYVDQETVPALGWADHTRSTIDAEGLSGAWERAVAATNAANAANATGDDTGRSALERSELATPAWAAGPEPESTVRVLTAANTVQRGDAAAADAEASGTEAGEGEATQPAERFAWLAPGIMAVRFQDSLSATLHTIGEKPETVGYSNDALRFDYRLDSQAARDENAAASIQLAAQSAWTYPGQPASEPVLLNPPASWGPDSAAAILGALAEVLRAGQATPTTLAAYLTPPQGTPIPAASQVGTPYPDPTEYSDAELLTATQQARFINDLSSLLSSDPSIALTRYGFTLPLRRDILAAFSPAGRRSLAGYTRAVEATSARLSGSRATLSELRSSVTLIPPGNVYTRTSPTSPLLIVARNGMPLPVDTTIRYTDADGVRLNVPEQLSIPARGSVTVQMTADLPENVSSTNLSLYLAGPQGDAISSPVEISVRTPSQAVRGWVLLAAGTAVLAFLLLYNIGKRVRRRRGRPRANSQAPPDAAETAWTS